MGSTIFFSVGEPSGDLHGANLVRELTTRRPNIRCVGYGGPKMADAGCELHTDLTQYAVMGIVHVIAHLRRFIGLLGQANHYFKTEPPDAVVLIDYPGFNWWIARKAKANGIPVFYYGTPQLWAWAPWRVKKMQRLVDHVLCKLPFEPEWFQSRGCQATFVGHPYFDELANRKLDLSFVQELKRDETSLVTILPGSRDQEVAANLPGFLKAVAHVQSQLPNVRFAIASFSAPQAATAKQMIEEANLPDREKLSVHIHRTPELIEAATVCLACSGSVSLELLYHTKPSIILYQTGRLTFRMQDLFRTARYITLVNLLSTDSIERDRSREYDPDDPSCENVPMPEYLTCEDRSEDIARRLVGLLTDPTARNEIQSRLLQLRDQYGIPGASERAANYILENVPEASRSAVPKPKMIQRVAARRNVG